LTGGRYSEVVVRQGLIVIHFSTKKNLKKKSFSGNQSIHFICQIVLRWPTMQVAIIDKIVLVEFVKQSWH
jgi:hypothetical protein